MPDTRLSYNKQKKTTPRSYCLRVYRHAVWNHLPFNRMLVRRCSALLGGLTGTDSITNQLRPQPLAPDRLWLPGWLSHRATCRGMLHDILVISSCIKMFKYCKSCPENTHNAFWFHQAPGTYNVPIPLESRSNTQPITNQILNYSLTNCKHQLSDQLTYHCTAHL